jgi:hypothetical protein
MAFTVVMLHLEENGTVSSYELDGAFATAQDALAAGSDEMRRKQAQSETDVGFQIRDAEGRAVLQVPAGD